MKKKKKNISFVFSILFAVFIYLLSVYAAIHDVD